MMSRRTWRTPRTPQTLRITVRDPDDDTVTEVVGHVLRCSRDRLAVRVSLPLYDWRDQLWIESSTGRITSSIIYKERHYTVADLDELRRVVAALAPEQKGQKPC
jgi:hypothetical protein